MHTKTLTPRTSKVPLARYGCLVWLERELSSWETPEILMWQPITGSTSDASVVTQPPDQQFLDDVNRLFHTSFTMDSFPQPADSNPGGHTCGSQSS